MTPYTNLIRSTRLRLGEAPRNYPRSLESYLRIKPPAWIRQSNDQLGVIYRDSRRLLVEGRVVWGCLVVANSAIFAAGKDDLPGVVVYSPEYHRFDNLLPLEERTKLVSQLKEGERRTAEEKQLGAWTRR